MQLVFDYKENELLRKSFNELSQNKFGRMVSEKLWNDKYECYSIKIGEKIISNVSVNKFQLIINEKKNYLDIIGSIV